MQLLSSWVNATQQWHRMKHTTIKSFISLMLIPFSGIIKTVKTRDMFTSCVSLAAVKGDAGESSQSQMNALMMLLYGFLSSDILFGFFFFSLPVFPHRIDPAVLWVLWVDHKSRWVFSLPPQPFFIPFVLQAPGSDSAKASPLAKTTEGQISQRVECGVSE